jgi:hypothetical protein
MSKIIFKKIKKITDMHFDIKNYLKTNHNHTDKEAYFFSIETEEKWKRASTSDFAL